MRNELLRDIGYYERLLDELALPPFKLPFNPIEYCETVNRHYKLNITVEASDRIKPLSGMYVGKEAKIAYRGGMPNISECQAIMHEVFHKLRQHRCDHIFVDFRSDRLLEILGRSEYESEPEVEAEMLATVFMRKVMNAVREWQQHQQITAEESVTRLRSSL